MSRLLDWNMNKVYKSRFRSKKCSFRKNSRGIFIFFIFGSGVFIFILGLFACKPTGFCFGLTNILHTPISDFDAYLPNKYIKQYFNESVLNRERKLNLEGEDVLIYLHIQKTGGATFGRHLVHNLDVDFPCKCQVGIKRCHCLTKNRRRWLFSRHATGWMCGLHADWTELMDCVDDWFKHTDVKSRKHRMYHYITFLRNPVSRFFSEWQHVQRGATWISARLHCNGRDASLEEVPFCFSGVDWSGVTLDEFLSCKHNLAFNRMTRMLANLSKVNCYDNSAFTQDQLNDILLRSAKENLIDCAFFGIVEEQRKTQFLFENTLGIRFINNFKQKDTTHASLVKVQDGVIKKVLDKNQLDIELYQFSRDLFHQRVAYTEKKLGYTVDEYFNRVRGAESGVGNKNVNMYEYDEEYDNEGDDYIREIDNFDPNKNTGFHRDSKANGAFRRSINR